MNRVHLNVLLLVVLLASGNVGCWSSTDSRDTRSAASSVSAVELGRRPQSELAKTEASSRFDATNGNNEFAGLAESKQRHIWEIEHISFELETRFGQWLTEVLKRHETSRLIESLRLNPTVNILDRARSSTTRHSVISYMARDERTTGTVTANGDEFAEFLMGYVVNLHQISSITFRVVDVRSHSRNHAVTEIDFTAFLSGTGVDSEGKPACFESTHDIALHFRDESEIASPGVVCRWQVKSERFGRSDCPLMEEVTEQTLLNRIEIHDNWNATLESQFQYNFQIAVDDFNRDGYLDIVLCCGDGPQYLLQSERGERFVDVSSDVGLPSRKDESAKAFLATWIDYDNDAYPDLLLGNRLYKNLEGKHFRDVTQSSGLTVLSDPMGCAIADYDCDGWLDLYMLYHHSDASSIPNKSGWIGDDESGLPNQLWRNEGNGTFRDVTESVNAGSGRRQSFAAAWMYLGSDRYPDVYVVNDFGTNVLLENRGSGQFRDVTQAFGVGDFSTSMGVASGDLDGDGATDLYVANMYSTVGRRIISQLSDRDYPPGVFPQIKGSCAGSCLYTRDTQRGPFHEASDDWGIGSVGWAHAPALIDLDADGYLDIHATSGFMSFHRDKPDG